MRHAEPFTLYKRGAGKRGTYYYQFRNEDGPRATGRSTGKSTRAEARAYVLDLYKSGALTARSTMTFGAYAGSWWKWDECQYITGKLARGHRLSRGYANVMRTYLDRHILPVFEHTKLVDIPPQAIEPWLMGLT